MSINVKVALSVSYFVVLTCAKGMETAGFELRLNFGENGQPGSESYASSLATVNLEGIIEQGREVVEQLLMAKECVNNDGRPSGFVVPIKHPGLFVPDSNIHVLLTRSDTVVQIPTVSRAIHTTLKHRIEDTLTPSPGCP